MITQRNLAGLRRVASLATLVGALFLNNGEAEALGARLPKENYNQLSNYKEESRNPYSGAIDIVAVLSLFYFLGKRCINYQYELDEQERRFNEVLKSKMEEN